ncbi:hypothetical protein [Methylomagnum sp.]
MRSHPPSAAQRGVRLPLAAHPGLHLYRLYALRGLDVETIAPRPRGGAGRGRRVVALDGRVQLKGNRPKLSAAGSRCSTSPAAATSGARSRAPAASSSPSPATSP